AANPNLIMPIPRKKKRLQSRRSFLNRCSIASLGAVVAPALLSSAQARTTWLDVAKRTSRKLTYAKFAAEVNTPFRAILRLTHVDLTLVQITDLLNNGSNPAVR